MDHDDPVARFERWWQEAIDRGVDPAPTALATVGPDGRPSVRMVLLRGADHRGFVFYTDLRSRKSREITARPWAALCLYWEPLGRQVRVEGRVEPVGDDEADRYFAGRPRESQIGAWASMQSEPLDDRRELDERVAETTSRYDGRTVPRPPTWSGWRIVPDRIEFWVRGHARLHDRDEYRALPDGGWRRGKLYP